MAIREIRKDSDEILRKISKKVDNIDDRITTLLDDMAETMKAAEGVGLAAPQVGILRRVVVIDVGDGLIELINPVVVYEKGEQCKEEGCLSIPGKSGIVKRPEKVIVRAQNRKGETFEITGEDLLAVALCHEIDHLNGILFTDKAITIKEQGRE
ncbi:peptide deformylase [Lutispora saccharofermentans]|uniref:Peptide deformylase n=1 Tax=Lutispora saccharofermentans TaxID=3024236 RepID=A0ABT1NBQ4_9FIRM|nr:peptide deformylase [Lutispora saccharofermentans]MCQ1528064.1 peptide deformylase [Lutispora saccharofermentans]